MTGNLKASARESVAASCLTDDARQLTGSNELPLKKAEVVEHDFTPELFPAHVFRHTFYEVSKSSSILIVSFRVITHTVDDLN